MLSSGLPRERSVIFGIRRQSSKIDRKTSVDLQNSSENYRNVLPIFLRTIGCMETIFEISVSVQNEFWCTTPFSLIYMKMNVQEIRSINPVVFQNKGFKLITENFMLCQDNKNFDLLDDVLYFLRLPPWSLCLHCLHVTSSNPTYKN